jgi:type IV pilus assembly protein PilP
MKKNELSNRIPLVTVLLLVLAAIPACKKQEGPPPPPPAPAVKTVKPVQLPQSSAKIGNPVEQLLDFSHKKDPFRPLAAEPSRPKSTHTVRARMFTGEGLPIQSFDVMKFRVSGIISGFKENTALVIDPTGKGYVVKEGMLMGNMGGRISRITPSAVDVVEQYQDDHGRTRKRTIRLTLHKKQ